MKKSWKNDYIYESTKKNPVQMKRKLSNKRSNHQESSLWLSKIYDYQESGDIFYSLELSPPKDYYDFLTRFSHLLKFIDLHPVFLSVTNLTNINETLQFSSYLNNHFQFFILFHLLGCQIENDIHLKRILMKASSLKLNNFLALQGDQLPKNNKFQHALDLMRSVKKRNVSNWGIAISGYPNTHPKYQNSAQDIYFLQKKIDEGGDLIITQLFYEPNKIIDFVKKCRSTNINTPIMAGFMPLQNYENAMKISAITGVKVPNILQINLKLNINRPEATRKLIVDHAVDCLKKVLNTRCITGIHFFTLNRFHNIAEILNGLNFRKQRIEYPFLLLK